MWGKYDGFEVLTSDAFLLCRGASWWDDNGAIDGEDKNLLPKHLEAEEKLSIFAADNPQKGCIIAIFVASLLPANGVVGYFILKINNLNIYNNESRCIARSPVGR